METCYVISFPALHQSLNIHTEGKRKSSSFSLSYPYCFTSQIRTNDRVFCTQQYFFLLFNFLFSQECDRTRFRRRRFTIGYSMITRTYFIGKACICFSFVQPKVTHFPPILFRSKIHEQIRNRM